MSEAMPMQNFSSNQCEYLGHSNIKVTTLNHIYKESINSTPLFWIDLKFGMLSHNCQLMSFAKNCNLGWWGGMRCSTLKGSWVYIIYIFMLSVLIELRRMLQNSLKHSKVWKMSIIIDWFIQTHFSRRVYESALRS